MPPNILDGNDLERGRRFEKICHELFDGVANVEIGRILAGYEKDDDSVKGYSEGSIRRWKAGGPIGATALLNLQRLGVNLEYLLEGKQKSPPTEASGDRGVDAELIALCTMAAKIQENLGHLQGLALRGGLPQEQFANAVHAVAKSLEVAIRGGRSEKNQKSANDA